MKVEKKKKFPTAPGYYALRLRGYGGEIHRQMEEFYIFHSQNPWPRLNILGQSQSVDQFNVIELFISYELYT